MCGKSVGVVLLENPVGSGVISKAQFADEVAIIFGLDLPKKRQAYADSSFKQEISDNLAAVDGKTVYLRHESSRVTLTGDEGSFCRFVEVDHAGKKLTLLLENPAGCDVSGYAKQVIVFSRYFTLIFVAYNSRAR